MTVAGQHARCDELAAAVLAYCEERHFKIAAAESLTGGLLADAFVRIPGASKVFLGSVVTYDIRAKSSILGVDADLLAREGRCILRSHVGWPRRLRICMHNRRMATASWDCPPPAWLVPARMEASRQALHTSVFPCLTDSAMFAVGVQK